MQLSALPSPSRGASPPQTPSHTHATSNPIQSTDAPQQDNGQGLSEKEQRILAELKKTDRKVRAHEAAQLATAGGLVRGGASYGYTQGPDGQRYAVSGEVSIDVSPANTPEATLTKAQRIQAAALAPAQPSGADRTIAAASQMAATARTEMLAQQDDGETKDIQTPSTSSPATDARPPASDKTGERLPGDSHATAKNDDLLAHFLRATETTKTLGNRLNTAV